MPFTIAHPAIILPLKKLKWFSLTALIAGSIVPDFEFFFQMREVENIGHSWYGILIFDLPVALLFCFLFHGLLRNNLVANLPEFYRKRLVTIIHFNWNSYAAVNKWPILLSLLIGIASHILWDGFTHHDGLFVNIIPWLNTKAAILHHQVPVYFILQVLFSITGSAVIINAVHQMPAVPVNCFLQTSKWYWPIFSVILCLILFIRITFWPQFNTFWSMVMAVMGGISYSWLLVSVILKNHSFKKITP